MLYLAHCNGHKSVKKAHDLLKALGDSVHITVVDQFNRIYVDTNSDWDFLRGFLVDIDGSVAVVKSEHEIAQYSKPVEETADV